MFVGDSDLANLDQATTTPQGAQIVSTQYIFGGMKQSLFLVGFSSSSWACT
jgi:hypothetical protein